MSRNIEENYQKLANFIVSSISEEWNNAWIEVEIKEDFESVIGRYQKSGNNKLYGFKAGEEVLNTIKLQFLKKKIL